MGLLQAVASAGTHVVLLQVLSYQLDRDRAPAGAWVWLRIVAERVEMRQVLLDEGKSLLFVTPATGEIGLAPSRLAHALKDGGGDGLQLRFPGADHVDDRARGLGQFRYIFRRHEA